MMKKTISIFLVLLMILSVTIFCNSADFNNLDYPWDQQHTYSFYLNDESGRDEVTYGNQHFVTGEIHSGYLYLWDNDLKISRKISNREIVSFEYNIINNTPYIYMQTTDNQIICWHNGNTRVLYKSNDLISGFNRENNNSEAFSYIAFFDKDVLVFYDVNNNKIIKRIDGFVIEKYEGLLSLALLENSDYIAWGALSSDKEDCFVYCISTGENIPTESWIAALDYCLDNELYENNNQPLVGVVSPYQQMFPLIDYPVPNSTGGVSVYFTDSGNPCSDHDYSTCGYGLGCNCKEYAGGIQCFAFAKYCCDQYAHRNGVSKWNTVHKDTTTISLTSANECSNFMHSLNYGTYLRVKKSSSSGKHSLIVCDVTSTGLTVYECNIDHQCGVRMRHYTFEAFKNAWDTVVETNMHSFNNYVQFNATTHKSYCSVSGCGGYIYEQHVSSNPGNNAVCDYCGYIGYIPLEP